MNINYSISFDKTTKAIYLILDNFLVDALIQSRIKENQEKLQQSRAQVEQALNMLYYME